MTEPTEALDDIDRTILRILAQNPRTPYSDISAELEEEGHQMSSEGIRYRVSQLFETTSVLLLTAPKEHGWQVLRLFVSVAGEPDAKAETFVELTEMNFWMVCRTMGTFDLYGVATVQSNYDADELLSDVRSLEHVTEVSHALETDRETDIDSYLAI
jgi:DNA-binding Lrp family transcriptional regulator